MCLYNFVFRTERLLSDVKKERPKCGVEEFKTINPHVVEVRHLDIYFFA